jgi:hypothetical protein
LDRPIVIGPLLAQLSGEAKLRQTDIGQYWRKPNFTITQMDARITELVARLTALERERAEILAEINILRSVRSEEAAAIKAVPSAKAGDPIDPRGSQQFPTQRTCHRRDRTLPRRGFR